MGFENIGSLILGSGITLLGGTIIYAGVITGYYFIYQSLKSLGEQCGITLFSIAGLLYFIGAIAIILFGIGLLVISVGWIIHIVAYFSIQLVQNATIEKAD